MTNGKTPEAIAPAPGSAPPLLPDPPKGNYSAEVA